MPFEGPDRRRRPRRPRGGAGPARPRRRARPHHAARARGRADLPTGQRRRALLARSHPPLSARRDRRDVGAARVVDRLASVDPEAHARADLRRPRGPIRRAARRPRRGRRAGARARDHVLGARRRRGGPRHRPGRRGRLHAARGVRRPARDHLEPADLRAGAAHGGARLRVEPVARAAPDHARGRAAGGLRHPGVAVARRAARAGRHPAAHRRLRRDERAGRARAPAERRARRGGPDRRASAADGPAGRRGCPPTRSASCRSTRTPACAGSTDVWAAGDATDFPLKQGGIATQQADVAATAIAARAGAAVEPEPFRPLLRGILLTGTGAWWLRSEPGGGGGEGELAGHALWWPPSKIAGRWLSPYLAERDEGPHTPPRGTPLEVRLAHTTAPEGAHASAVHVVDVLALERPSSSEEARNGRAAHASWSPAAAWRPSRRCSRCASWSGRTWRSSCSRPSASCVHRPSSVAVPFGFGAPEPLDIDALVAGWAPRAARRARRASTATAASRCSPAAAQIAVRPARRRGRRAPSRRAARRDPVRRAGGRRGAAGRCSSASRGATPAAWRSRSHPALRGRCRSTSSPSWRRSTCAPAASATSR